MKKKNKIGIISVLGAFLVVGMLLATPKFSNKEPRIHATQDESSVEQNNISEDAPISDVNEHVVVPINDPAATPEAAFIVVDIAGGKEIIAYDSAKNPQHPSIVIPNTISGISVISIGNRAFYQKGINNLTIPNSVTTIGDSAFVGNALQAVMIPPTLDNTQIASNAFTNQTPQITSYVEEGKKIYCFPESLNLEDITLRTISPDIIFDKANRRIINNSSVANSTVQYTTLVRNNALNPPLEMIVTLGFSKEITSIYTARFCDQNGGLLERVKVEKNNTAIPSITPTLDGHTFIGWDKPVTNIIQDIEVKAVFKALPTITTKNVTIDKGSVFNPLDYINAKDADSTTIANENVNILHNNVDIAKAGLYNVSFQVMDRWGGKQQASYKVSVIERTEITHTNTKEDKILAKANFRSNAKLNVDKTSVDNNPLGNQLGNRNLVGSYNIHINGNYSGNVELTFLLKQKYEGKKIYVYHQKRDGSVGTFEQIVKAGKITIVVNEVSPFLLATDVNEIATPDAAFTFLDHSNGGKWITGYNPLQNPNHPSVVIPEEYQGVPIKAITGFRNKGIETLVLPNINAEIGNYAFAENLLTTVTIPAKMSIGNGSSFWKNRLLTSVVLTEGIDRIGEGAFRDCRLTSVTIPSSITRIEDFTFSNNMLSKVEIPSNVEFIGSYAFANNQIKQLTLSEGIKTLAQVCFGNDTLEEEEPAGSNDFGKITIPSSVKEIQLGAFINTKMDELVFAPNSKLEQFVGDYAFAGNSLLGVTIPSNVANVPSNTFLEQIKEVTYRIKDGTCIYNLPDYVDVDSITIETPGVTLDRTNRRLISDSLISTIKYTYSVTNDVLSNPLDMDVELILAHPENVHTVRFLDQNGDLLECVDIVEHETAKISKNPTFVGYTFIGWDKSVENVTQNLEVKAVYKALPTIITKDVKLHIGDVFHPLTYIDAKDADHHSITNIAIKTNNVNVNKAGVYEVRFEVTDQWGGKKTGSYQVTVIDLSDPYKHEMKDESTGISVKGDFAQDAKLIVEVTKVETNELHEYVGNRDVLGSYKVYITGNYKGKLEINFPIEQKQEGKKIYIYHQKNNGEVETFEHIGINGKITIIVDELSPFLLTSDKIDTLDPGDPNPEEPGVGDLGDGSIGTGISGIDKTGNKDNVDTGDATGAGLYVCGVVIALAAIVIVLIKNNQRFNK